MKTGEREKIKWNHLSREFCYVKGQSIRKKEKIEKKKSKTGEKKENNKQAKDNRKTNDSCSGTTTKKPTIPRLWRTPHIS